jgi:histidinol dehydrogenase
LVIADKFSNSSFVAADLLSQAEHGSDSQVVLLSDSENKIEDILIELKVQLNLLERKDISIDSLKNSFVILVDNIDQAIEISNIYAPEHLIMQVEKYNNYITKIKNA